MLKFSIVCACVSLPCSGVPQPWRRPRRLRRPRRIHQGAGGQIRGIAQALGIAGQKNLVELFVSKSGSWTMLMTTPEGMTCIMATGQSWEDLPAEQELTAL